jgi:hypothetical protein
VASLLLLPEPPVYPLTPALQRVFASFLEIIKSAIEVEPIPPWRTVEVDWLRHLAGLDQLEKFRAPKPDVGGRTL